MTQIHADFRAFTALERCLGLWHRGAMSGDELRQLLRRAAFRPLTVFAQDKAFFISHPEFAALSPRGDTLIIFHQDDGAFEVLDVPLIGRVEVHEPSPPAA